VATHGSLEVPAHLRPSTGAAAKREGWGAGYVYTQDEPEAFSASQRYLPTELLGERFYQPRGAGYEAQIKTRLEAWRARREGTSEAGFEARASSVESRDEPAPEASGPRGE
jgi:putative ATPase